MEEVRTRPSTVEDKSIAQSNVIQIRLGVQNPRSAAAAERRHKPWRHTSAPITDFYSRSNDASN